MPPDSSSPSALRRRILWFLTVVLAILLGGNALVCATGNFFWKLPFMPAWVAASFVLTLTFVGASIMGRFHAGPGLNLAYRVAAIWLGLLNYLLFASLAAWLLYYVTPLAPPLIGIICFGAAVSITLYGLVNAAVLRVTRLTVRLAHLPAAWNGRTVALVTDMHLGNIRGAAFTRRVVETIRPLGAEAIFISGDMFDGPEADFPALVEPWKTITGATKTFFVTGNHEEFTDRTRFIKAVETTGIRVLNNEKVEWDGLQIVGIHDEELHDPEIFRALLSEVKLDRGRAGILLAHQPKYLRVPAEAGIGLMLCGHTHGGQYWPWTIVARRVHKRFNHGLQPFEVMQVFTSYGAGTWGAPLRVGTKPEITLIRLEPVA